MQSASPKASQDARRAKPALAQIITLRRSVPELADGLLALVVTDIEGFTPLVERLGDVAAQHVLQTHNRILRQRIHQHAGSEVAHTGDGVIAAFRSVAAALECSRAIQRGLGDSKQLRRTGLRARIGVHAGEPLREEERLFGQCVNVTVRVCSQAGAGRVLVTDVVRQLAQGRFSFDAGASYTLKGVSSPLRLYQLLSSGRLQRTAAARDGNSQPDASGA